MQVSPQTSAPATRLGGPAFASAQPCWSHVQALRLEYSAALGLADSTMFGIAGIGHSLRQLALIGLLHVSDASVKAALEQMPMLQVRHTAVAQISVSRMQSSMYISTWPRCLRSCQQVCINEVVFTACE